MRYLFILNPAAGKQDCTVQLIPQLQQAAVRAGIPVDAVATCKTEYAGHAKALARAAAEEAAKAGEQLHIWTAGGDGTLVEALTGVQGALPGSSSCFGFPFAPKAQSEPSDRASSKLLSDSPPTHLEVAASPSAVLFAF